jgi:ketosteroid isomerase-like protein
MSERLETARRALSALREGDTAELGLELDPDITVRASGGLHTHRYNGLDALMEAYREVGRYFGSPSLSIDSLKEDDDGAVSLAGSVQVRHRENGERMRFAVRGVLFFRDGLIHRVYLRRVRRQRR